MKIPGTEFGHIGLVLADDVVPLMARFLDDARRVQRFFGSCEGIETLDVAANRWTPLGAVIFECRATEAGAGNDDQGQERDKIAEAGCMHGLHSSCESCRAILADSVGALIFDRLVEVHREPREGAYRAIVTKRRGDILSLAEFPDVELAVADVLY